MSLTHSLTRSIKLIQYLRSNHSISFYYKTLFVNVKIITNTLSKLCNKNKSPIFD